MFRFKKRAIYRRGQNNRTMFKRVTLLLIIAFSIRGSDIFHERNKEHKKRSQDAKKTPEQWEIIQIKLEKKVELKNETY